MLATKIEHHCKHCGEPCVSEGYCSIDCLQAVSLESAVTCQGCGRLIPAGEQFCSAKCAAHAIKDNRVAGNCPNCGKMLFSSPAYGCTPGRCTNQGG